jgi:uncharacterized delta-60 repeat protein
MKPSTVHFGSVRSRHIPQPLRILSLLLVSSILLAHGQPLLLDTTFQPDLGNGGIATALAIDPAGRVLVAADTRFWYESISWRIARIDPDGTVDPGFIANVNGRVERMVPIEDGRLLIHGTLASVDGQPIPQLARLNANGSLDARFMAPVPAPDLTIRDVQPAGQNRFWISGAFHRLNDMDARGVARLLENGDVDLSFQSPLSPSTSVGVILPLPDGRLIVAGEFLRVAGHYSPRMVRLNADGSLDMSFRSLLSEEFSIQRMALESDGSLLINGFNPSDPPTARRTLLRMFPDGTIDASFAPLFSDPGVVRSRRYGLAVQLDGRIVVAGDFLGVNSISRSGLVRLHADGSVDPSFDPGLGAYEGPVELLQLDQENRILIAGGFQGVESFRRPLLARLRDRSDFGPATMGFASPESWLRTGASHAIVNVLRSGDLTEATTVNVRVIGGTAVAGVDYTPVDGTLEFAAGQAAQALVIPIHYNPGMTRTIELTLNDLGPEVELGDNHGHRIELDGEFANQTAGAVDPHFQPMLPGPPSALLRLPGDRLLVAGRGYLKLLDSTGSEVSDFVQTNRLYNPIRSLAQLHDGRLLVGGASLGFNGVLHREFVGLHSDGTVDHSLNPLLDWRWGHGGISAMLVTGDGYVLCGGSDLPDEVGNPFHGWFRLSPDGIRIPEWSPNITFPSSVRSFRSLKDQHVIVAGFGFYSRILKIDWEGTIDPHFVAPRNPLIDIGVIDTTPDGGVVFQRRLESSHGPLEWLTSRGVPDPTFEPAILRPSTDQAPYRLTALSVQPDGRILVGGQFEQLDGIPRRGIARLHRDGSLDFSFDPGRGLDRGEGPGFGIPGIIEPLPEGGWLVAGDFLRYDGVDQPFLVRILPEQTGRTRSFGIHAATPAFPEGIGSVSLSIVRSGDASDSAQVRVIAESGSALVGIDFEPLDAVVEFAPGQWRRNVDLTIIDNTMFQFHRAFTVRLEEAVPDHALPIEPLRLTVLDDDVEINFDFRTFVARESDGFAIITLRRRAFRGDEIVVPLQVGDFEISAVFPAHQEPLSDTIDVLVPLPVGTSHEPRQDVPITLGQLSAGAYPGPYSTALLTILRDNPLPTPIRGVAGVIEGLAVDKDEQLFVAGEFSAVHGVQRMRVARLLPDGEVDPDFDPGSGPDGRVTALAVQSDGRVLIAGAFQNVSGITRRHVARLHTDGSLDLSFDAGAGPGAFYPYGAALWINSLGVQTDGRILVSGNFGRFGHSHRSRIARLLPNGQVDREFISSFHPSTEGLVESFLIQPDGRMIILGLSMRKQSSLDTFYRDTLFRLEPDGGLDPHFIHHAPDWRATAAAVLPNDQLLVAYRFAGTDQIEPNLSLPGDWLTIRRLDSDGQIDSSFQVRGHPVRGVDGANVRQLVPLPDGRILCRVELLDREGRQSIRRSIIARLLPDGAWDSSFTLLEAEPASDLVVEQFHDRFVTPRYMDSLAWAGAFRSLAFAPSGYLAVGGAFARINHEPRRSLTRIGSDGQLRGVLRLELTRDPASGLIRLTVSPEVQLPYAILASHDLMTWNPILVNYQPWTGLDSAHAPPAGHTATFYRAVRIE